jgi:heme O synthase-like polyprenyltransferase
MISDARRRPIGAPHVKEYAMIILGLILLVLGFVLNISILWTIGIILIVIGAVLYLLGSTGRMVGGRRHYW